MTRGKENSVFGRRKAEHVLILASGDKVRHVTVRPWMAALAACTLGVFAIGYLGATAYLIVRDDLIGATRTRHARMQHDYEGRIASLRAQLDRVTSRQMLDQQKVERKVELLLEQQDALSSRHGKLDSLMERAEQSGLLTTSQEQPGQIGHEASLTGGLNAIDHLLGQKTTDSGPAPAALAYAPLRESLSNRTDDVFSSVAVSLREIEQQQLAKVSDLTVNAAETREAIAGILKRTGIELGVELEPDQNGLGGPFMEPASGAAEAWGQETYPAGNWTDLFDNSLDELGSALDRLDTVRETARALPYGNPAPGHPITSRYGNRIDPFLGRLALHAGIDFRAKTGAPVKSTGAGKIVKAGASGGYGHMVEVDHGHGITTRYGHLSRILVHVGDTVSTGDVIGRAGSTGRSTGPHVHYEVRRNGKAVDPMRFLNAGMKLDTYLN